jgi:hypothetical protein
MDHLRRLDGPSEGLRVLYGRISFFFEPQIVRVGFVGVLGLRHASSFIYQQVLGIVSIKVESIVTTLRQNDMVNYDLLLVVTRKS